MNEMISSNQTINLFSFSEWRDRFLKIILRAACVLGFLALVLYFISSSTTIYRGPAFLAYGILVLITFVPRLPYSLRAGVFLVILYLAGFASLIRFGIAGASILLFGFIVMLGLLFSPKLIVYIVTGIVSILLMWVFGGGQSSLSDLATLTAIFLVVLTMIVAGLHTFQQEFTRTHQSAQQTLETLSGERNTLEQRVEELSGNLVRKSDQLRATSYIARKTAEVQELSNLLNTVANLVTDQFGFYHTGVFLLNETGDEAVLQAASSEGGRRMIERGHALAVGIQGIVGFVAAQKKPRIALDVGTDAVFFNNPDLPLTRSEVALPLLVHNRVLGILDIQSDKPQAFSVDDIDVLQTLADQVAVAIENAGLLSESQAALTQLEALTAIRTREAWSQKLREKSHIFTYTPLGMRAEKMTQPNGKVLTVPLTLRGQTIGSLSIVHKGDSGLNKSDEELIVEVASQASLAIDNIRLLEEATQRAKQEQVVGNLAGRFSQSLDIDTLLQTAVRELAQFPDVSEVSVLIGKQSAESSPRKNHRRNTG